MKNPIRLGAILIGLLAFVVVFGTGIRALTGSSEVVVSEGSSPATAPGAINGISPVGSAVEPAAQEQAAAAQVGDAGAHGAATRFLDWPSQARGSQAPSQPSVPPAPGLGGIRGVVTGAGSVPLQGIDVFLADTTGTLTGKSAVSGPAGDFSFGSLAPGGYRIFFSDPSGSYQSGWYGDPSDVNVAAGTETNIFWSLTRVSNPPGTITGTVSDDGGNPVAGVEVLAYAVDQPLITLELRGMATTGADGSYSITGLSPLASPPGSPNAGYKVLFIPPAGEWSYQWYRGQSSYEDAELLPVMAGETVGKVNAQLQLGGSISGRVTGEGQALAGALVEVFDSAAIIVAQVRTGPDGRYQTASLPAGDYRVRAGAEGYESVWYDGKSSLGDAVEVAVTAAANTGGIDFSLARQQKAAPFSVNIPSPGPRDGSGGHNAVSKDAGSNAASPGIGNASGSGSEPGIGNASGSGSEPGAGNANGSGSEPGAGNEPPGAGNEPAAGDETGSEKAQDSGVGPGARNTPGVGTSPGEGNAQSLGNQQGAGNSGPGIGSGASSQIMPDAAVASQA